MTTTKTYNSIATWTGTEIHLDNIDIGPHGDLLHGQAAIKGDRWKRERIGFATAPYYKLIKKVDQCISEAPYKDAASGQKQIWIANTEGFFEDDNVYIYDNDNEEARIIDTITENAFITLKSNLLNSYHISKKFNVSTTPDIQIEKITSGDIVVDDYVEIEGSEAKEIYEIIAIDDTNDDYTIVRIRNLLKGYQIDDWMSVINTSTKWTIGNSPTIREQRKNWWDYAGQNVRSAEIYANVDVQEDSENKIISQKNGAWIAAEKEAGSGQIALLLSKDEEDIDNWTDFLGDSNSSRINPILRSSYYIENFDYDNANELKKVWDTEDGTIALDVAVDGTCCMEITYSGDGSVYGLAPVPYSAFDTTMFSFNYKGRNTNDEGDLIVTINAADGTSTSRTYSNVLTETDWTTETFSISSFGGRKYIKSVKIEIDCTGSGVLKIDALSPFMPPREDEIIEDPSVLFGQISTGENNGLFACYFTGRERPRQILTANATLDGLCAGTVEVGDTSDFAVDDVVVVYDRDNYEMGKVRTVVSGTRLIVEHLHYDEDNTAEFENDYNTNNQAMIANNTFKTNKIYGAYVFDEDDLSNWVKYPTNENPTVLLEPGSSGSWDDISVRQPSVVTVGNRVYIAYVGTNSSNISKIGFATSADFINFTKYPNNPLLPPSVGKFDSDGCFHPNLVYGPRTSFLYYTGYDGTNYTIGSAVYENKFTAGDIYYHVSLLVWPDSTLGNPPKNNTCVLYDQGNFRIEINSDNEPVAYAYVDGEWINTPKDQNAIVTNAFGTKLPHDHWSLIIAQWAAGKLSIHLVSMKLDGLNEDYFTNSPWLLTDNLSDGDSTITLQKHTVLDGACDEWIDDITDYSGTGQDILLYGNGYEGGTEIANRVFQINRVTSVTDNGDGTFDCDLLNPIGPWGFSETNLGDTDKKQGVVLAQGMTIDYMGTCQHEINYLNGLKFLKPTTDTNKIFEKNDIINSKDISVGKEGVVKVTVEKTITLSVGGSDEEVKYTTEYEKTPQLDFSLAKPPVVGSNQALSRAWNLGFIGYVDCALDILEYNEVKDSYGNVQFGGRCESFAEIVNNTTNPFADPKPKWHEFDLTGDGSLPTATSSLISRWDINNDYDAANDRIIGTDVDGNCTEIDLYLAGSAAVCDDGYLGKTLYMTNRVSDSAGALFYTDNFDKLNSGDAQFEGASIGWSDSDVSASHLFKFNNQYRLAYTGKGRETYETSGTIIGDLFETSLESYTENNVTFTATFEVPSGCEVELYMSWSKKTDWIKMWSSLPSVGTVALNETFTKSDGETEAGYAISDFKYFVRWKLNLKRNSALLNQSPIVKSFQVEYTEPPTTPSTQFFAEQDKMSGYRRAVYKVVLHDATNSEDINITDRVKKGGISNLTHKIPLEPDKLANIIASDVTITVENTDKYFSENESTGVFYNRNYLDDEIRIYAGFKTADSDSEGLEGEFEVMGRFLINRVKTSSKTYANIECRSLLRAALDTRIGDPEDGEENPLLLDGKIKDIMEQLLQEQAGIDMENLYIEDFDREFGNVEIKESTIAEVIQHLAKACDGIVYTDNQGDIYFKTWANLCEGDYHIISDTNLKNAGYTGQDYDRLAKKAIVTGVDLVEGLCESDTLTFGRDIRVHNPYLQKQEWADDIAEKIIQRYGINESEVKLKTVYLPSIKILDTVEVTSPVSGLITAKYLVHNFVRNVSLFEDDYGLSSNLAVE